MLWVTLLMENNPYHIPVLLHVATDALIQNKNGCYVDLTFGGGGHSKEILSKLDDEYAFYQLQMEKITLINFI